MLNQGPKTISLLAFVTKPIFTVSEKAGVTEEVEEEEQEQEEEEMCGRIGRFHPFSSFVYSLDGCLVSLLVF